MRRPSAQLKANRCSWSCSHFMFITHRPILSLLPACEFIAKPCNTSDKMTLGHPDVIQKARAHCTQASLLRHSGTWWWHMTLTIRSSLTARGGLVPARWRETYQATIKTCRSSNYLPSALSPSNGGRSSGRGPWPLETTMLWPRMPSACPPETSQVNTHPESMPVYGQQHRTYLGSGLAWG